MDIAEAIRTRKSIRGYKPDPVPKKILREILELAARAPSSDNSQPWETIVITGDVLENLKKANIEALASGKPTTQEYTFKPYQPIYRERQISLGIQIFQLMDIAREDKAKRDEWMQRGFRFFDAPTVILLTADKSLEASHATSDIGGFAQTICLAALEYGLGTCIASQALMFSDIMRSHIDIPDSKRLFWFIMIGYPDWDFPANKVQAKREPLETNSRWLGFDE